jgi:acyl carrier protein
MRDQIRKFINENFLYQSGGDNSFEDYDSFLEKGIIDSTGVLELVAFLEKDFSVIINDEELIPENLDSVNNLVLFLQMKKNAG